MVAVAVVVVLRWLAGGIFATLMLLAFRVAQATERGVQRAAVTSNNP